MISVAGKTVTLNQAMADCYAALRSSVDRIRPDADESTIMGCALRAANRINALHFKGAVPEEWRYVIATVILEEMGK